jgi:hypothetical protein
LSKSVREWKRADAEKRVADVFDDAKSGRVQRISDTDGVFEIIYRSSGNKSVGEIMARGGPIAD